MKRPLWKNFTLIIFGTEKPFFFLIKKKKNKVTRGVSRLMESFCPITSFTVTAVTFLASKMDKYTFEIW